MGLCASKDAVVKDVPQAPADKTLASPDLAAVAVLTSRPPKGSILSRQLSIKKGILSSIVENSNSLPDTLKDIKSLDTAKSVVRTVENVSEDIQKNSTDDEKFANLLNQKIIKLPEIKIITEPACWHEIHSMARKGSLDYFLKSMPPKNILDSQDKFGETAINYAAMNGHLAIVNRLLQLGANPDIQSYYIKNCALMHAIESGHENIVKALVDAGSNVNLERNAPWSTALEIAKNVGSSNEIIELLSLKL